MQRAGRERLHFLDSLRGLAAIYVVFFHVLMVSASGPTISNFLLSQFVHFGGTGVFLFFVISGFSLSLTMPKHDARPMPAISYGLSRFFRIAPLFYAVLVPYFLWSHATHGSGFKTLALNMAFLFNLVPNQQGGLVWASWTIGVEMLFYLAFLPIKRSSLPVQALICLIAIGGFAVQLFELPPSYTYFSFLGYFPMFMFGMWAFDLFEKLKRSPKASQLGFAFVGFGVSLLLFCMLCFPIPEKNVTLRLPIGLGYAALLVGCGLRPFAIFETAVLRYYGRISYSVYLLHAPIVFILGASFLKISHVLTNAFSYWVCACAALAIVTPLATITYLVVELPFERVGKWLISHIMGGTVSRVPA